MGAKTKTPGVLLMVSSILGAVLGGTFVAVCMILSFIGGLLALIGAKSIKENNSEVDISSN
jgi:uncharacterized membrane protein